MYVNRKIVHYINIQAICDSDLKYIDVVAKWPGSTHHDALFGDSRASIKELPAGTFQPCMDGSSVTAGILCEPIY